MSKCLRPIAAKQPERQIDHGQETFVLDIGMAIRNWREHQGLLGVELAKMLGVSQAHLSLVEQNKRTIGPTMTDALLQQGMTLLDFFPIEVKVLCMLYGKGLGV
jgi:ribosome-binding protein aMBF1 (putative translation factor)